MAFSASHGAIRSLLLSKPLDSAERSRHITHRYKRFGVKTLRGHARLADSVDVTWVIATSSGMQLAARMPIR